MIEEVQIAVGSERKDKDMCDLLKGMRVNDAISRLEGIDCHGRGTSCPDQMAKALRQMGNQ